MLHEKFVASSRICSAHKCKMDSGSSTKCRHFAVQFAPFGEWSREFWPLFFKFLRELYRRHVGDYSCLSPRCLQIWQFGDMSPTNRRINQQKNVKIQNLTVWAPKSWCYVSKLSPNCLQHPPTCRRKVMNGQHHGQLGDPAADFFTIWFGD